MTLKLRIIQEFENGLDTIEIAEKTKADVKYVCRVKKMLKNSGIDISRYHRKTPELGTKSEAIYRTFLLNPKAKAVEVSKALGVTLSLCQKVRFKYFGIAADPKDAVKLKRQILPQPKAMFDVDLSELKL